MGSNLPQRGLEIPKNQYELPPPVDMLSDWSSFIPDSSDPPF